MFNLLAAEASGDSDLMMYILLGVVGGLLLICAIYGLIRKFTRLTWIGWELLIVFALDLILPKEMNIAVSALLLVLFCVLPLVGEYFLRRLLVTKQNTPVTGVANFFDHFGGMFTAIVGFLSFFLAVGGLALSAMGAFMADAAFLDSVPAIVMDHALDFFLIAVCFVTLRAGCRLGVLKGLNYLCTVLLVFGAFFGCLLLFSQVGWGRSFSRTVGGWFGVKGSLATIVGAGILTLFFSLILFVGIMFLSRFVDGSIRKANSHVAVAIPDALILGAIYLTVFIIALLGIQAVFGVLAQGEILSGLVSNLPEEIGGSLGEVSDTFAQFGQKLATFAQSSPISCGMYLGNPFLA